MSTGLMSLAYLGELAVVFNLAYIELKKTRYVEAIKRHVEQVKGKLALNSSSSAENIVKLQKLIKQIEGMLTNDSKERKESWYLHQHNGGNPDGTHHDWYAGALYNFFATEKDKVACQAALIVATVLIIIMTTAEHFGWEEIVILKISISIWWVHYCFLLVTNIIPAIFVLLGRRMKSKAINCSNSVEKEFQRINETTVGNVIATHFGVNASPS